MDYLTTQSIALSEKADELLEKHHQRLFALGLDITFNRSTLATKYWRPLPDAVGDVRRNFTEEQDHSHDQSNSALALALTRCQEKLVQFEQAVEAKDNVQYVTSSLYKLQNPTFAAATQYSSVN